MESSPPTVYLSFRAADTDREVDQLRHSLEARAGAASAQPGVASLGPDASASDALKLRATLVRSAVVLVVVGPHWADARGPSGQPALADPADPIRLELLDAIERRIPMLVVLVRGARMVRAADLPPELTAVAQRPSVEIHPSRWEFDVAALVELVKPLLGTRRPAVDPGSARRVPATPEAAQVLRDRAARLAPGVGRSGSTAARGLPWLVAVVALFGLAGAAAWWWIGDWPSTLGVGSNPVTTSSPPLADLVPSGPDRVAALRAEAAVASAVAQAAARAAEAAAGAVPPGAAGEERERWQSEVQRLREEALVAQDRASALARRVAEVDATGPGATPAVAGGAQVAPRPNAAPASAAAVPRIDSLPPRSLEPAAPIAPPPLAVPTPAATAAAVPAPAPSARSAEPAAGSSAPASLTLANWAIATSSGCGAGELRAVGTNEVTITRTAQGILVTQAFQGTAGPWRLGTSGSAVFDAPRPSYDIESSGLWTRDGSQPFRSISRLTVSTRDGGLVPAGARGSQYRTECPGG